MVREIRPGHSLHVHWRDYPRLEEVTMELTDAKKRITGRALLRFRHHCSKKKEFQIKELFEFLFNGY